MNDDVKVKSIAADLADIVVARKESVILRGRQYTNDCRSVEGLVRVSRDLFFAAVTAWLDDEARHFETYREFCGGSVIHFVELTSKPVGVHFRTRDGDINGVLAYDAAGFIIDMERT